MKFSCKTENLKNALSRLDKITSKKTSLPILENILLEAKKGFLYVCATNLEIGARIKIGVKTEESGSVVIPGKILGNFLSLVKDDNISLKLREKTQELEVTSQRHQVKIKGLSAEDFPSIPRAKNKQFFQIEAAGLRRVIPGLLTSVAYNDSRQELNGIYMRFDRDQSKLILAATDSFRLAEARVSVVKDSISEEMLLFWDKKESVILPAVIFSEIQRSLLEEGLVEMVFEEGQLFVKIGNTWLVSRIISGNYPEYQQIIPKEFETQIEVKKEELEEAVKIASIFTGVQKSEIKIKGEVGKKRLEVSNEADQLGENYSQLESDIKGKDFQLLFNSRYVLEGLTSGFPQSERLFVELNPQNSPVLIKGISGKNKKQPSDSEPEFFYLVMPINRD
jgi:DNA polymerase-3 subunit beta